VADHRQALSRATGARNKNAIKDIEGQLEIEEDNYNEWLDVQEDKAKVAKEAADELKKEQKEAEEKIAKENEPDKERVSAIQTMASDLKLLEEQRQAVYGAFRGKLRLPFSKQTGPVFDKDYDAFEGLRETTSFTVASAIANQTGRALSDEEREGLMRGLPELNDTDATAKQKIENLVAQVESRLIEAGKTPEEAKAFSSELMTSVGEDKTTEGDTVVPAVPAVTPDPTITPETETPIVTNMDTSDERIFTDKKLRESGKYDTPGIGFKPLDTVAQLGANAAYDIEEMVTGISKVPSYIKEQVKEKGLVGGVAEIGKGLFSSTVDQYTELVKHPIKSFYERPVSTFLDLLPFTQWAKGKALAKIADSTGDAARVADAAGDVSKVAGSVDDPAKIKIAPFEKSFNPEILDKAKSVGIDDLPVSAQSSSRVVQGGEALVQKGFFGSKVAKEIDDVNALILRKGDDLIADFNKTADPKAAGIVIQKGFGKYTDDFYKQKSKLYNSAKSPKLDTAKVNLIGTKKGLTDILKRKGASAADDASTAFYQNLLDEIKAREKPKSKKPMDFDSVKQTRTTVGKKLGDRLDPIATGDKADLGLLYGAISDDMDNIIQATDPATYKNLKKANLYYKDTIAKLDSGIGRKIKNAAPEKLIDDLVKPNSETNIALVKEMIGPEGTVQLQQAFVEKLVNSSLDKNGNLDNVKLNRNTTKYTEPTLAALLTPDQLDNLKNIQTKANTLADVSTAVKSGTKSATGSQTAHLQGLRGRAGAYGVGMFIKPVQVVTAIMGEYAASRLFSSKAGRDLMTTGLEFSKPQLPKVPAPKVPPLATAPIVPIASGLPDRGSTAF